MHRIQTVLMSEKHLTFPAKNEMTVGKALDGIETQHLKAKSLLRSICQTWEQLGIGNILREICNDHSCGSQNQYTRLEKKKRTY